MQIQICDIDGCDELAMWKFVPLDRDDERRWYACSDHDKQVPPSPKPDVQKVWIGNENQYDIPTLYRMVMLQCMRLIIMLLIARNSDSTLEMIQPALSSINNMFKVMDQ